MKQKSLIKEEHSFGYLDKSWKLKKRSEAPNAPWYLIVRWGKREASGDRAKDWIPLKSKETGLALDKEAAENRAKFLIKEHFKQQQLQAIAQAEVGRLQVEKVELLAALETAHAALTRLMSDLRNINIP